MWNDWLPLKAFLQKDIACFPPEKPKLRLYPSLRFLEIINRWIIRFQMRILLLFLYIRWMIAKFRIIKCITFVQFYLRSPMEYAFHT